MHNVNLLAMTKTSLRKIVKNTVIAANRLAGHHKRVIWIVGDGRSGTSWLADLINYHNRYLYIFEPLHPNVFPFLDYEQPWLYLRPDRPSPYQSPIDDIFTVKTQGSHVRANRSLIHDGVLIKDIHGHLLIDWVAARFPNVRKILLLRHPFAVALSKSKLRSWRWMEDPTRFLAQEPLRDTYLSPFKDIIPSGKNYFENQVIIWSIVHYIALKQAANRNIHLSYYESLCVDYKTEVQPLFDHVGDPAGANDNRLINLLDRPSSTSARHSAVKHNENRINGWQRQLTARQIEAGETILREFGLHEIYNGTALLPDKDAAQAFITSPLIDPPAQGVY